MSDEWEKSLEGDERDEIEITTLLEIGYDRLDGFVQWLESTLRIGTRSSQQDCFNAECLIDYLANHHRKAVDHVNEFELRWFFFHYYPRNAMADEETEERLPDSLRRFFEFLYVQYHIPVAHWVYDVLDDRAFYDKRRHAYHELNQNDEQAWQEEFRSWTRELEDDLDIRCLLLPLEIGQGLTWNDMTGWREATLRAEANRQWQQERDELLLNGLGFDVARERLYESYLIWLETPQDRLNDQTPQEVIESERAERGEEIEEDDMGD